jgi:hypothetical protein
MSFLRHKEIYRSDGRQGVPGRAANGSPQPHRVDEFPAEYSLAGCSPAEPAAASPAASSIADNGATGKPLALNGNLSSFTVPQPWGALQDLAGFSLGDFFVVFFPFGFGLGGPGFVAHGGFWGQTEGSWGFRRRGTLIPKGTRMAFRAEGEQ